MSLKNASNESHDGWTYIPLAPYFGYFVLAGFLHLFRISAHILCTLVFAIPCVMLRALQINLFCSTLKQPQDCDSPDRKVCPSMDFSTPQEQRQSHSQRLFGPILSLDNTVSRPNLWLAKSMNAGILCLLSSIILQVGPIVTGYLKLIKRFCIMNAISTRNLVIYG